MSNVLRSYLVAIVILAFMIPSTTFAGWQSLKDVHKSALKDALAFAPAEFQKTFAPYEEKMLNEVDSIQVLNPPSWYKYQVYYQNTVKIISTKDSSRYDTAARFLTDMTIYLFAKYAPIKAYESCRQDEILKRAFVVYDGRNSEIDYQKMTNDYFEEKYQYASKENEEKLLEFYNRLVNETLNVWISIWENAGEDVADIPQKNSILREKHPTSLASKKQGISNIEIESNRVQQLDEAITFSDADLKKSKSSKQTSTHLDTTNLSCKDLANLDYALRVKTLSAAVSPSSSLSGMTSSYFSLLEVHNTYKLKCMSQEERAAVNQEESRRAQVNRVERKLDRIDNKLRYGY